LLFRVDAEEQAALLALARRSLADRLGASAPSIGLPPRLEQLKAGGFVTLRTVDGGLRGCIGRTSADAPVGSVISEMAVAAGTRDPRFPSVTREELPGLVIEVSLLGPPMDCAPSDVVVGRDGLMVEQGGRRGLLLPQVATERGWSAEQFLDATCTKAGLPPDAWRRGARLQRFEAVHFEEAR